MNARIFKKKSKQAMNRLIEEFDCSPADFIVTDGRESLDCSTLGFDKRVFGRRRVPLKGTPIFVSVDYFGETFEATAPNLLELSVRDRQTDYEAMHYGECAARFGLKGPSSLEYAKMLEDVAVAFSNMKIDIDEVVAAFKDFGGSLTPELLKEFEDARDRVDSWERA